MPGRPRCLLPRPQDLRLSPRQHRVSQVHQCHHQQERLERMMYRFMMIHRGSDIRINPTHRHQVSLHFYKQPPPAAGHHRGRVKYCDPKDLKRDHPAKHFFAPMHKKLARNGEEKKWCGMRFWQTKFWGEMVTGAQTITIYHTPEGASHRGSWRPLLWVYFTPNSSDLTPRNT